MKDTSATFIATILVGISGVIINTLIGRFYGIEALGIYNRCLAYFMIFSVITVWGINTSLIKHTAEFVNEPEKLAVVIISGLILTVFLTFLFSFFIFLSIAYWGFSVKLELTMRGLILALPVFSINRSLFGILNGLREMIIFSKLQALRWLLFMFAITVCTVIKISIEKIGIVFLITESILLILLGYKIKKYIKLYKWSSHWVFKHLIFGFKSMLTNSAGTIARYADIIIIGLFCSNTMVGLYSFASEIAKGIITIPAALHQNFNPIISKLWSEGKKGELLIKMKKIVWYNFIFMSSTVAIGAVLYPIYIYLFMNFEEYASSLPVFYILCVGAWVFSIFYAIYAFPMMIGKPEINAFIGFISLLINILLNLVLIQYYKINGAAIATSISWILSVGMLLWWIKKNYYLNAE